MAVPENALNNFFVGEVLERSIAIPVLVEFWAPWCEPCKWLEPIIDEMYAESNGQWQLIKINIDEMPDVADYYNIRSVPAVRVFLNGEIIGAYNGMMWKKDYQRWLGGILNYK